MCASASQSSLTIDPNDSRLTEQILKVCIPEPLKSLQAIRINELPQVWRKAISCDDCGRAAMMLKDKIGHTWTQIFHCAQRYCENCAIIRAQKMLERFSGVVADALRENAHISKFRYVIAKRKILRERNDKDMTLIPEDVATFNSDIAAGIKAIAPAGSLFQTYIWTETDTLEARIIILGEHDISVLQAAFPSMTLLAATHPVGQLYKYLRELLGPDLPESPIARAEAEYLADELRLFRATGVFYNRTVAETLDVDPDLQVIAESGELITEDGNSLVNNSPKNRYSHCPHCHLPATAVSESFPADGPVPNPEHLRWKSLD